MQAQAQSQSVETKNKAKSKTSTKGKSLGMSRRAHSLERLTASAVCALAPGRRAHGGSLSKGVRKLSRPLDRKRPVHLVFKSSSARGALSFLRPDHRLAVDRIIAKRAKQFAVKIHGKEVMSNHIHLVASFSNRTLFQNFMRTVSALIARHVTGARRGRPFGKRFWDDLLFSRVVSGRRDFRGLTSYLQKNQIERDIHPIARLAVEEYERAAREARLRRCDIWEILSSAG